MTVDIARLDQNAIMALGNANDALDRLARWVDAASNAHRLVAGLVDTAFIPDAYKPRVDPRATAQEKAAAREVAVANATAAVLQGVTLGIDPLMALQQIYIVHGRPGMYAKMMVALVQARGHEVWTEDISDSRAVVCGRRAGTEYVERVTVTMDQARKAQWTKNEAYTKTPQDMLWARAAARVCDRIASDVLKGIASVEEVQDTIKAEAAVVGNGTRTVSRRQPVERPALPAAEVPPLEADEPTVVEATTAEPGITTAQSKKLYALLRETGRADRDVALVYISGVLDRVVESTKDLTKREAIRVIDELEKPAEPEPDLDEDRGLAEHPAGDWAEPELAP